MSETPKFVQGNEACVEAALYAGLEFFAGYPITPSTEIAEHLSVRLPQLGGKFIQMEDEIASMCAIIGASLTGHKVMTATSGPGFSLMQEALGYAIMAEIPCVIVNVQRGGPSTGLPTHVSQGDVNQARWGTHGDHAIIAMTASNHQDLFAMTVEAFNMAETYRTPVVLLFDEVVGHMREKLVVPARRDSAGGAAADLGQGGGRLPPLPAARGRAAAHVGFRRGAPLQRDRAGARHVGVSVRPTRRWSTACCGTWWTRSTTTCTRSPATASIFWRTPRCVLISYGSAARSRCTWWRTGGSRGERLGLLELQTLWPFPDKLVREKCANANHIVVVEMNMGQVAQSVKLGRDPPGAGFSGQPHRRQFHHPDRYPEHPAAHPGKGV
jgi:2-oxoglutarate/2-oxoacid ferredoxin oxidoreductase subunit alpha